ncbi:putative manganese transport mntH domain protein [Mycobacterium kansasii 824]|nr:putative manganese transport mntH domain protein [Mycobacterium kansasii 824]
MAQDTRASLKTSWYLLGRPSSRQSPTSTPETSPPTSAPAPSSAIYFCG